MKKPTFATFRAIALASMALCTLGFSSQALAANHALIMTIDYVGVLPPGKGELIGVAKDAALAEKIAQSMGVPSQNIHTIRNSAVTLNGMGSAIQNLTKNQIANGDKVFIYYSGHGFQQTSSGGSKCTESMVTHDLKFFEDDRLRNSLDQLAKKASQVVMFNDSCFSGGAATKDMSLDMDGSVAKVYVDEKALSASDPSYVCGQASNKDFGSRTLGVVARDNPTQVLYVAASADTEVSRAGPMGSWATLAWASCMSGRSADRDGNGIVDARELRDCSQTFINQNFRRPQTITLVGNTALPVSLLGGSGGGMTTAVSNPRGTLEALLAAADPGIPVGLSITKSRLMIGRDLLDFSVTTERPGYLHLLHVASNGKFYVLFPNKLDSNNFVQAGAHRFPRASWGIQAQGPVGTSYVMAYLSDSPKDFSKDLELDGPFATAEFNTDTTRKLGVIALNGRFGASAVAAIQEVK